MRRPRPAASPRRFAAIALVLAALASTAAPAAAQAETPAATAAAEAETPAASLASATAPRAADQVTLTRANLTPGAGLDSQEYLDAFQIPVAAYASTQPGRTGWELSRAFDGDWNTTYMAMGVPTEAVYTIDFAAVEELSTILFRHIHTVQQNGFPTHIKLLVSETGEADSYREVADYQIANAQRATGPVSFSLSEPVRAKSVKFQVLASPAGIVASEFKFLRYDAVASRVNDLFANAERTQLNDAYATEEALTELQAQVEAHPAKESLLGYVERAWMVLRGELKDVTAARTAITAGEGVDSAAYLGAFQLKASSIATDRPGAAATPLENAFDGDWSTRYQAQSYADPTTITIDLGQMTDGIDRLIYATGSDNSFGYPTRLALSYSLTGREGSYQDVSLAASSTAGKVLFTLSEPVRARYVKLSLAGIEGGANFRATAAEIKILRHDELDRLFANGLFQDKTEFTLKDEYNSEAALTELQARVDAHPSAAAYAKAMARAWKVFRGEVKDQNDRYDWPVHIVQKTGDDAERINWAFLAEGYRADEMDKFVAQVTERVNQLLQIEPYRSMAPYMNIYAYCAESNESGISYDVAGSKDSFFGCVHPSSGVGCSPGKGNASTARTWIEKNFLDEGGKLMHATLFVNDSVYYGSGGYTSVASYGGNVFMISHEAAHFFANLVDEYANESVPGDKRGVNMTANADPKTIRWREFLGFRGTGVIYQNGKDASGGIIPALTCTMNHAGQNQFCEVCRDIVFWNLNAWLKSDKRPLYVAVPETTIHLEDSEKENAWSAGKVITEANITEAEGKKLEFRTMVSNFLTEKQDVTLRFTVTGVDGTVKAKVEQTFSVRHNKDIPADILPATTHPVAGSKSISVVTPVLTGLEQGDKITGEVLYQGEVQKTDKSGDAAAFATVSIDYRLVDADGNDLGELSDMSSITTRVQPGLEGLPGIPEAYGYTYDHSSMDEGAVELKAGEEVRITRFYRASSAILTQRLVDANGLVIKEKSRRVATGETVEPAASDFDAADGYKVVAPAAITMGSTDTTLTYTLARDMSVKNIALKKSASAHWMDGAAAPTEGGRPASMAVDGVKNDTSYNYVGFGQDGNSAGSYLQVDFGGLYQLSGEDGGASGAVKMWRYWSDNRTYLGTVIVASENGTFAEGDRAIIYNSDAANFFGFGAGTDALYKETSAGKTFDLPSTGVRARAIRVYMHGRSATATTNHICELEVFGTRLLDDDMSKLQQAIDELQAKVESGRYTAGSAAASQNAIEEAKRALYQGSITDDVLKELLDTLASGEAKLTERDTTAGSIEFLGGSLRYTANAAERLDGLRLGYRFAVPKGAEIDWEKTGWSFGLTEEQVVSGRYFQKAVYHTQEGKEGEEGSTWKANIVLTKIPAESYGATFRARAQLVYTLDGETVTLTSDAANSRSVNGVAGKIIGSATATDVELDLAQAILGR